MYQYDPNLRTRAEATALAEIHKMVKKELLWFAWVAFWTVYLVVDEILTGPGHVFWRFFYAFLVIYQVRRVNGTLALRKSFMTDESYRAKFVDECLEELDRKRQ